MFIITYTYVIIVSVKDRLQYSTTDVRQTIYACDQIIPADGAMYSSAGKVAACSAILLLIAHCLDGWHTFQLCMDGENVTQQILTIERALIVLTPS